MCWPVGVSVPHCTAQSGGGGILGNSKQLTSVVDLEPGAVLGTLLPYLISFHVTLTLIVLEEETEVEVGNDPHS